MLGVTPSAAPLPEPANSTAPVVLAPVASTMDVAESVSPVRDVGESGAPSSVPTLAPELEPVSESSPLRSSSPFLESDVSQSYYES